MIFVTGTDYWIGAIRDPDQQLYSWLNSNYTFTHDWMTGQRLPITTNGCLAMWEQTGFRWSVLDCDTKIGFLCERPYIHALK